MRLIIIGRCSNNSTRRFNLAFLLATFLITVVVDQVVAFGVTVHSAWTTIRTTKYNNDRGQLCLLSPFRGTTTSSSSQYSTTRRRRQGIPQTSTSDIESKTDLSSITSDMAFPAPLTEKIRHSYTGKTALITGATGGLGKALALQLVHWKIQRLILSARKQDALEQVAKECREVDPSIQIDFILCDLSDANSVQQMVNQVVELSKNSVIDILINNGGVSSRSRFVDTDIDVDAQVMQINFLSGAALAKAVVPGMVRNPSVGGRIIWISSVQGLFGIPNRSSYAASKFAVQGYTESIRAELKSSGVTVHTVSPGYIRTGLSQRALTGDGTAYGRMDATTAAGADPEQVATESLQRIAAGEVDFTIAAPLSALVAYVLRFLFPSLLRLFLVKRYEKSITTSPSSNEHNKKDD